MTIFIRLIVVDDTLLWQWHDGDTTVIVRHLKSIYQTLNGQVS